MLERREREKRSYILGKKKGGKGLLTLRLHAKEGGRKKSITTKKKGIISFQRKGRFRWRESSQS